MPVAPTGSRRLAPGTGIDAHRHDDHQIVHARSGVIEVITEAGSWVAPPSRALWIPAGTVHEHRAHGSTELRLIGLPGEMVTQDLVHESPGDVAAGWRLPLDRPAVLSVDPLLRELILAYTDSDTDSDTDTATGSGSAFEGPQRDRLRAVLLDRLHLAPRQPVHLPSPADPRLARLCRLLHDDPADERTLDELGRVAGASGRTLARLFRRDLGMTFPQWRTQLRLHRALLLLAEGAQVTTVAHRCGWASASAFIHVYKQAFGHTPGRAFTM
ncbi:AraC family transcriptional regulator [Nonomuraea soli]|uniref:HTH-type transcriptional regulator RipA n=1 Tax=Nonomuraea soli TaxID=1032476 RepID=A0A7W0CEK3_9ACTN|nr:helix-turn-helix transcriptional regulator [Nonomuraea soli]MBA2889731.1 AraC-like DNA-binding protein [Nonomuraea soli]